MHPTSRPALHPLTRQSAAESDRVCVKEREGMTKRQKSRRKRKTFVKKIWIWNENMLEMNWNRNGLSGPNESLHERASKKCQSRCRTFHALSSPFSQAIHNVANKTAHKKQYTIKSKENWAGAWADAVVGFLEQELLRCLACCPLWQMEMKGKHDSVNEWRTLLLTGDCFVLDAMWVRNLATSIENVDWPDWLPSSWLAGWLKMDLDDEQTWNVERGRGAWQFWHRLNDCLACRTDWLTNERLRNEWLNEWINERMSAHLQLVAFANTHTHRHTDTQTDKEAHIYTVTNSKFSSGKSLLNLAVTVVVRSIQ